MGRRLDAFEIEFAQARGVFQHLAELDLKKRRFLRGKFETRETRHIGDIEVVGGGVDFGRLGLGMIVFAAVITPAGVTAPGDKICAHVLEIS